MQISRKLKTFSEFFTAFLKSTLNLVYFDTKDQSHSLSITEIINCETGSYLNVQRPSFMQRFGRQQVKGSQTLLRSARFMLHTTLPLICAEGTRKRLVLVRSKFFGQFVNTLTADYQ